MKWFRHLYQPCLPLGPDGRRISGSKEHIALSRAAAREGIVLLKNEGGILPLAAGTRVVLLGKAGEEYIKGGGGSGDVSVSYVRSLYESLEEKQTQGKLALYPGLHPFYREAVARQHEAGIAPGMTVEPELSDEQLQQAADFADTAILAICRFSGEGWDRSCGQSAESHEMDNLGASVFYRGDFYLSREEEHLVAAAKRWFRRIIVVLNVGGMVDTAWFAGDPAVQAALFAGQGGMEGAMALGDILCGDESPCGRLVDTFADSLEAYPSSAGFHDSEDFVEYTEDIYVGYRYFETIPGAWERVVYPFGYGLSYTQFEISPLSTRMENDRLLCRVRVTNLGSAAGKEVVQLYVSAPAGRLGKAARQLCAFDKTPLLEPGASAELELTAPVEALASYDDQGLVQKSAWVLEAGTYRFFLGSSVRQGRYLDYTLTLERDRIVSQLTEKLTPRKLRARMRPDGSFLALPVGEYEPVERAETMADVDALEGVMPESLPIPRRHDRWSPYALPQQLQLASVAEGTCTLDELLDSMTLEEQVRLLGGQPNTGVANTFGMGNNPAHGVPNIMTADGPAGLRIQPELGVHTTAWPCATSLACTWNRELVNRVGRAAALEVRENNIGIWLAPALNIHRSPLCGRNFEYYSEDPMIAGEMGTAMVLGVQSMGIAATPKHFAFNNKETNRKSSDSRVSERAAREIYLRGFETIVRKAKPWLIMSSYNLVNGTPTSENRELLTDILRDEWGYEGIVTTDWWTRAEQWREILAGNDVKMANGYPEQVLRAVEEGKLPREQVRLCARRVLTMILRLAD